MLSLLLTTCLASPLEPVPTAVEPSQQTRLDHMAWDVILRKTVRDERVDYVAIRDGHWDALNAYIDRLAEEDLAALGRDAHLAGLINLYNATMIKTVIERLHAEYSPAEDEFKVFSEPLVRLRGKMISLNALENEIIRPTFNEPRIHVALVCAAESCPPLVAHAYTTNKLEATLQQNMERFVQDDKRNAVDHDAKALKLSSIFDWYNADFGGKDGVPAYVDRFHPASVGGYSLGFKEYSWTLNAAKPEGRVIATKAETKLLGQPGGSAVETVRKGALLRVLGEEDGGWKVMRPFGRGEAWVAKSSAAAWSPS